jgi:hypothetical protein
MGLCCFFYRGNRKLNSEPYYCIINFKVTLGAKNTRHYHQVIKHACNASENYLRTERGDKHCQKNILQAAYHFCKPKY